MLKRISIGKVTLFALFIGGGDFTCFWLLVLEAVDCKTQGRLRMIRCKKLVHREMQIDWSF